MSWASRAGRARTNPSNPQAHAICQRCGFRYNRVDISDQYDWAGASLVNKMILVCRSCKDVPQEQLRAIVIPADPVPIYRPSIQDFVSASSQQRTIEGEEVDFWTGIPRQTGEPRATQSDFLRFTQQTGEPPNGINNEPGISNLVPDSEDVGLPYQNDEIPETG